MNNLSICYLNHDVNHYTGSGKFFLSLSGIIKNLKLNYQFRVLTSEDLLLGSFFRIILKFFKIRSILKNYNIIHALDGWPYGFIAVLCSWGLDKKIIITAIGTGAVQPLYQSIKKQLMIWAYRRANQVVAVSRHTRDEILKIVPDLNIEVINHGVDFDKFQTSSSEFQEINNLKPYILSVGALKKRKGFEYSIKAFAQIAPKFPDLKYVIVGQGPECEALKLKIRNQKLENRIIFFNQVKEAFLIALYKNAELFILLPQDDKKDMEGFGLVFLEAAACGLPVIASRNSSAEDAVLNGQNGFLVDKQNCHQAVSTMIRILSHQDLKIRLSERSTHFAQTMSWSKAGQAYLGLYSF